MITIPFPMELSLPETWNPSQIKGSKRDYLAAEVDSSSSHWRIWRMLRRNIVADCFTSPLRSITAAVTPATVKMKFVIAINWSLCPRRFYSLALVALFFAKPLPMLSFAKIACMPL